MNRAEIAAYIRAHTEDAVPGLVNTLRENVAAYRQLPEAMLTANVRESAEVVAHLVETGNYPPGSTYVATLAEIRLRYKFTIGDVIRGILAVRDFLINYAGKGEIADAIARAMDRVLTDFAERFHALQLRAEKERSEQLVRMQEQLKRHELERQVQQAERLASLGQLAAGLAHEVGTPLNIISGNAEYVLMHLGKGNPRRAELRGIIRQTERITGMIRRLLDYARPKPLSVEPLDVNELVRDTVAVFARQAEKSGVEMRLELDERLPELRADGGQLEQLFVNLGLNAIQAMPDGGTLTIRTRRSRRRAPAGGSEPMLVVVFADTGVGIAPRHRRAIFEPFFSTKVTGEGTGLGLAVSQRIVEDHGGDIRVQSRPGHGATFTVRLPLKRSDANG